VENTEVYRRGFMDFVFLSLEKYFKAGIVFKIVCFIPAALSIVLLVVLACMGMYFYIRLKAKMEQY